MNEEKLMAFIDGQLSPAEAGEVEAALKADPALAAKAERMRALSRMLSRAYDPILDDPVPERLLRAARALNLVDFAAARERRGFKAWSGREWGAMAASLAGGLLLGFGAMKAGDADMIVADAHGMRAKGALARALDVKLAADAAGVVRIGLSFRAESGQYCRTFSTPDAAGLACRGADAWRIELAEAHARAGGDYRQAASELPPALRAAVEARIEGEPFDAAAEAAARARKWRK